MAAYDIPVKKFYKAEPHLFGSYLTSNTNSHNEGEPFTVDVYFSFFNDKQSNLGVPLPKGILRAYKPDKQGVPQLIGEDSIKHTAENEWVSFTPGNPFDVNVYGKVTDSKKVGLGDNPSNEKTSLITVKNAKDEAIEVDVRIFFPKEWQILEEDIAHEKLNANYARWKVNVEAKSQTIFTYKVRTRD